MPLTPWSRKVALACRMDERDRGAKAPCTSSVLYTTSARGPSGHEDPRVDPAAQPRCGEDAQRARRTIGLGALERTPRADGGQRGGEWAGVPWLGRRETNQEGRLLMRKTREHVSRDVRRGKESTTACKRAQRMPREPRRKKAATEARWSGAAAGFLAGVWNSRSRRRRHDAPPGWRETAIVRQATGACARCRVEQGCRGKNGRATRKAPRNVRDWPSTAQGVLSVHPNPCWNYPSPCAEETSSRSVPRGMLECWSPGPGSSEHAVLLYAQPVAVV